MGDTFDRVTEERFYNSRLTKMQIMADYVDLIDAEDENEEIDEDDNNNNSDQFKSLTSTFKSHDFGNPDQKKKLKKVLYVVQIEDELT